ncbi:PD-(D/E)XK motif protein [Aeromicrobium duanguangcaii]|uniref:PD-(D/E)XK motif protein n=1 Tax=Aeromicrobium duanguangcaii TaxID=2968086 RepID=A0ABY5KJC1_9ACTN|nr:PD-(D/E)XK motif protein [Aeromicrobium duanguangcaii]MCD9153325.1 PD-(D/E)XK motif protein [Aeromicrobium duanguangcaii]UUI69581.1 PD-(D/E)XK motif protein [Aeromicrobium duanguangcaii]
MGATLSELNPATLEKYFRSGTVTTHLVSESPEALIRIDGPGQTITLLTPHTGMVQDTAELKRVSTGIENRDGATWARIAFDARNMYAEAYGLMLSIVQAMHGGATFAAATSAAMTNMKSLLAAKSRISDEKQVGLIGELLLFRTLLDAHDEYAVTDWWLGPLAEERDYAFPAFDVEVKTTLGERRTHVIHGTGQLEPSPGRSLWLVSVQLTRAGGDPHGITLPGLVQTIRERLTTTRDRFVTYLASEGWEDTDAAMYPTSYILRTTPAAYLVDDDFPALTPSRLHAVVPHSDLVSAVTYRVDVSSRTAGDPGEPLSGFISAPPAQEA